MYILAITLALTLKIMTVGERWFQTSRRREEPSRGRLHRCQCCLRAATKFSGLVHHCVWRILRSWIRQYDESYRCISRCSLSGHVSYWDSRAELTSFGVRPSFEISTEQYAVNNSVPKLMEPYLAKQCYGLYSEGQRRTSLMVESLVVANPMEE